MKHQGSHLCILLTLLLLPLASSAESESTEFGQCCKKDISLRPNESVNCFMKDRTVKVTWIWKGERRVTTRERGYLVFDVADGTIASQTVAFSSQTSNYRYLFDEIFFNVNGQGRDHCEFLNISNSYQPRQQRFGPEPQKEIEIAVSSIEPVTLNEWKLELSGFASGSTQSVLLAKNIINNTTKSIPVLRGTVERIGRFQLHIINIFEETHLIQLLVDADPDLTIQGGDTYVPDSISINDGETLGAFLDRMGKQYGFEVEWVAYPGHPESVDFLKNLPHLGTKTNDKGNAVISDQISGLIYNDMWQYADGNWNGSSIFSLSWPDAKHLRVETVGYDKVLAAIEEKQRYEADKAKLNEEWERDYKQEIRVYTLKKITPITAKGFIDPCLSGFVYSMRAIRRYGNPDDITAVDRANAGSGNWIVEQCIADERANTVIVNAIPATHKKIEELLARMEGMITEGSTKGQVKQYCLEVTLLRGAQQGPTPPSPTSAFPSAAPAVAQATPPVQASSGSEGKGLDTPIADVSFPNQKLTEVADLLSTLGGVNINVSGSVDSKIRINYVVKTEKTIRQIVDDLGELYNLTIDYRPDGVFIRSEEDGAPDRNPLVNLPDLGISAEDLKLFGPNTNAEVMGRGAVTLIGQPGEEGKTLVALTPAYTCEIQYMDTREPYLIIKGTLLGSSAVERAEKLVAVGRAPQQAIEDASKEPGKPLLQNTLYLEGGKPSLLGLTNLRESLILLVKWRVE